MIDKQFKVGDAVYGEVEGVGVVERVKPTGIRVDNGKCITVPGCNLMLAQTQTPNLLVMPEPTRNEEVSTEAAHPAVAYLMALFEPGDRVNIKLIHATEEYAPGRARTDDLWGSVEEAIMPDTMELLAQKQREGWHLYICMSPLQPEAGLRPVELGNRVEELISDIRTVYVNIAMLFRHD
jgi:hypothetical protein